MSKSAGTGISPNEVVLDSGAEILRLWVASSDYHEDVRCSEEILKRTVDAYRKIRNAARFALGNLDGFEAARDSIAADQMEEIDRWALTELDHVIAATLEAYERYEFHEAFRALYHFCTVTLSARYFDIIKDRLYTYAPRNVERRSAQTVLMRIVDALAKLLAPVLVFTADEIWEHLPRSDAESSALGSVHIAELTRKTTISRDEDFLTGWNRLVLLQDQVLGELEKARTEKLIGSALEACVV